MLWLIKPWTRRKHIRLFPLVVVYGRQRTNYCFYSLSIPYGSLNRHMDRQTLDLISEMHIINGPLTIRTDRTDLKIILTDRDSFSGREEVKRAKICARKGENAPGLWVLSCSVWVVSHAGGYWCTKHYIRLKTRYLKAHIRKIKPKREFVYYWNP